MFYGVRQASKYVTVSHQVRVRYVLGITQRTIRCRHELWFQNGAINAG